MHHLCPSLLVQSCSALLGVLPNSNTTWASCSTSVPIQNVLSQAQPFRTSAACQLILLLDCWSLLHAPCCRIPRTANTQIQKLQIPSFVTFKTSHTACLHCTCWRKEQEFIGTVKLTDRNASHPPHVQFGSTLRFHSVVPSNPSVHDQVQLLSCIFIETASRNARSCS